MNTQPRPTPWPGRMTADEYLAWAMDQPSGRFELVNGEVVAMAAERVIHVRTKGEAYVALRQAIRTSGLDCQASADGMAVRIDEMTVYEPDAQVRCGPRLADDAVFVPDPLVVVEIVSPSTRAVEMGKKLVGYFALPSVRHYLVIDLDDRTIVHHRRLDLEREGGRVETRIQHARGPDGGPASGEGDADLILDPPGLTIRCLDLFAAP